MSSVSLLGYLMSRNGIQVQQPLFLKTSFALVIGVPMVDFKDDVD